VNRCLFLSVLENWRVNSVFQMQNLLLSEEVVPPCFEDFIRPTDIHWCASRVKLSISVTHCTYLWP